MAYHSGSLLSRPFPFVLMHLYSLCLHTEDAEREKALKDIVVAMAKEKGKAAEAAEKKA